MKLSILAGSTSQTVNIFIRDSSSSTGAGLTGLAFNTASLTAYYSLPRAAAVSITLATQTVTGAFSSGGFVEISSANMPGWYRFDIPDAALASGRFVDLHFKGATNMAPTPVEIELTAWNNQDGTSGGISRIDAAVSSRMATYTQPTGFLAATFPGTVASTTNITAGTITTATNVTTVNGLAAGVITTASIADNAITSGKIATGAIDADAIAADAVAEIQSGLATATAVDNVDNNLAISTAAILAEFGTIAVASIGNGVITAVSIADGAFTSAKFGSNFIGTGSMASGAIHATAMADGSIRPLVLATDSITSTNLAASAVSEIQSGLASASILNSVATNVTTIVGTTNKLETTLESDGSGGFQFTTLSLENAPSGGGGGAPTVQQITDGVLNELLSAHTIPGSVGAGIAAASSAGDPWATLLPGLYPEGSAGYIIGLQILNKVNLISSGTPPLISAYNATQGLIRLHQGDDYASDTQRIEFTVDDLPFSLVGSAIRLRIGGVISQDGVVVDATNGYFDLLSAKTSLLIQQQYIFEIEVIRPTTDHVMTIRYGKCIVTLNLPSS